jgi:hypothetical protein
MKTKLIAAFLMMVAVSGAFAAATVSDIAVRQRWPWSGKVDIDYTLTGGKGDVTFYATWDGQTTPVCLGTDFQVEAGQHRFEWDPSNKYADKTLTGFTVTAQLGDFASNKYIILDLVEGGYTFASEPPEGGWTDEYKSTKMVFARCPAGVYTNGMDSAELKYLFDERNADETTRENLGKAYSKHVTTFTSDWYVGICGLTEAQYSHISTASVGKTYKLKNLSYETLRGKTNDTPIVNWPITKYHVTPGSVVDILRKKAFNSLVIDLPTEEQYEAALRCGTTTYWPFGGNSSDSYETLTNMFLAVSPETTNVVGYYGTTTNAFGLLDFVGYASPSICLDVVRPRIATNPASYPFYALSDAVDPVGLSWSLEENYGPLFLQHRVVKGPSSSKISNGLLYTMPFIRQTGRTSSSYTVRFAIHLKPLAFKD